MKVLRSRRCRVICSRLSLTAGLVLSAASLAAQSGPGPLGPGPGCNLFSAPASVGTGIDLSYFGPPPSETNSSLVGPVQLLRSGVLDTTKGTITLPLYKGFVKTPAGNKAVWYIPTDVNDAQVASLLGLNYSAKIGFANSSARTANLDDTGTLIFDQGTVNFLAERVLARGSSAAFPPQTAQPGSVGDAAYR